MECKELEYNISMFTVQTLLEDYNWREAFQFARFNIEDVAEIIVAEEGENDAESWVGVFKLKNGNYGYVDAWCDYTGWDCQSGGDSAIAPTLEELQRFHLTKNIRERLGMRLDDLDGQRIELSGGLM